MHPILSPWHRCWETRNTETINTHIAPVNQAARANYNSGEKSSTDTFQLPLYCDELDTFGDHFLLWQRCGAPDHRLWGGHTFVLRAFIWFVINRFAVHDVCNTERGWAKRTLKKGLTSSPCVGISFPKITVVNHLISRYLFSYDTGGHRTDWFWIAYCEQGRLFQLLFLK